MDRKLQVNIYTGLPMVLEKINTVALAAVIGKGGSWINNKHRHNVIKGKAQEFVESDIVLMNSGLELLGDEITQSVIVYDDDREKVIEQIKELRKMVYIPYICSEVLKVDKSWFDRRMRPRTPGGKVCSFKEDDVFRINMGVIQIANQLKSIEFTL
jgi:hypothetical protein